MGAPIPRSVCRLLFVGVSGAAALIFRHGGVLLLRQFHALRESEVVWEAMEIAGGLGGIDVDRMKEQCPAGEAQHGAYCLPVPVPHVGLGNHETPTLI